MWKTKQNNLELQFMCCISISHMNYIFSIRDWGLREWKTTGKTVRCVVANCHMQVHLSRNYITVVILSPNYTSLPSMMATFPTTYLIAVLQPSGYSVFHGRNTPIQLSLSWWSYSCQCLNTETSAWSNRGYSTETPSISYSRNSYIRLVVTL